MSCAVCAAALAGVPRVAQAAAPCDDAGVSVEGQLDPPWMAEVDRICAGLRDLPDRDRDARVRVVAGGPVVVIATLADGRTAHRVVPSIGALERTIDALVTIPPSFEPPVEKPLPPPVSAPSANPPQPAPPRHSAPPGGAAPPPSEPGLVSVELGLLGTGRVEGTPLYTTLGLEGSAGLNVSDWLFGLSVRFDGYEAEPTLSPESFQMMTFGGGLDFARRIEASRIIGVDIGLGVSVLEEVQSASFPSGESAGEATDVRLTTATRAHFGGRGARFSLALEGELSPVRVGRDRRIDSSLPTLPAFGVGLGAGVSWQSR